MLRRAAILLAILTFASPANADIAPPPDSPDAHCSLKEQCPHGELCPYRVHPGRSPEPGETPLGEACRAAAEAKGFERRCRDGGNYGGQGLYCPKGETGSWSPPGTKRFKCSVGVGDGASGGALVFGGLALVMMARRWRRSR